MQSNLLQVLGSTVGSTSRSEGLPKGNGLSPEHVAKSVAIDFGDVFAQGQRIPAKALDPKDVLPDTDASVDIEKNALETPKGDAESSASPVDNQAQEKVQTPPASGNNRSADALSQSKTSTAPAQDITQREPEANKFENLETVAFEAISRSKTTPLEHVVMQNAASQASVVVADRSNAAEKVRQSLMVNTQRGANPLPTMKQSSQPTIAATKNSQMSELATHGPMISTHRPPREMDAISPSAGVLGANTQFSRDVLHSTQPFPHMPKQDAGHTSTPPQTLLNLTPVSDDIPMKHGLTSVQSVSVASAKMANETGINQSPADNMKAAKPLQQMLVPKNVEAQGPMIESSRAVKTAIVGEEVGSPSPQIPVSKTSSNPPEKGALAQIPARENKVVQTLPPERALINGTDRIQHTIQTLNSVVGKPLAPGSFTKTTTGVPASTTTLDSTPETLPSTAKADAGFLNRASSPVDQTSKSNVQAQNVQSENIVVRQLNKRPDNFERPTPTHLGDRANGIVRQTPTALSIEAVKEHGSTNQPATTSRPLEEKPTTTVDQSPATRKMLPSELTDRTTPLAQAAQASKDILQPDTAKKPSVSDLLAVASEREIKKPDTETVIQQVIKLKGTGPIPPRDLAVLPETAPKTHLRTALRSDQTPAFTPPHTVIAQTTTQSEAAEHTRSISSIPTEQPVNRSPAALTTSEQARQNSQYVAADQSAKSIANMSTFSAINHKSTVATAIPIQQSLSEKDHPKPGNSSNSIEPVFAARLGATTARANTTQPLANTTMPVQQNLGDKDQLRLASISDDAQPLLAARVEGAPTSAPHLLTAPTRTDLPAHIARQIADVVQHLPNKPVEISLNPEELGRLRLAISITDAGLTVNVVVERPETLDLLRRHISTLDQEFQSLGYEDVAFSFNGDAPSGDGPYQKEDDSPQSTPIETAMNPDPANEQIYRKPPAQTGLDIRL